MSFSCNFYDHLGHHVSWDISIKVKSEFDIHSLREEGLSPSFESLR